MQELRDAGVGNKSKGKDQDTIDNLANLWSEKWVPLYNKHNRSKSITLAPPTGKIAVYNLTASDADEAGASMENDHVAGMNIRMNI